MAIRVNTDSAGVLLVLCIILVGISSVKCLASPSPPTGFTSKASYLSHLSSATPALPKGFTARSTTFTFVPVEAPDLGEAKMSLTLIQPSKPCAWRAALTKNALPGAPIKFMKSLSGEEKCAGVLINNKISNVHPKGLEAIDTLFGELSSLTPPGSTLLPSSTGVIGWSLPVPSMVSSLPSLLSSPPLTPTQLASSYLTTDRYPKLASYSSPSGSLVGTCKGAGMIEPNMGTMLCYLLTDWRLPEGWEETFDCAVEETFNCVSVDGDESTSDQVIMLSSGEGGEVSKEEFGEAMREVCGDLARAIVRNGEGTGHVITVKVVNFPATDKQCRAMGKAVVNSPLVKTAVAGNDPNVGRVAGAVGSWCGREEVEFPDRGTIDVCGVRCYEGGGVVMTQEKEDVIFDRMKGAQFGESTDFPENFNEVLVVIDGGGGEGKGTVWGSDLTKEYVAVNADYRS